MAKLKNAQSLIADTQYLASLIELVADRLETPEDMATSVAAVLPLET